MSTATIYNYLKVNERLITGGQPTEAQLRAAAAEGIGIVINLATYQVGHSLPDEAELARSLGMEYYAIPVDWERPTESDFETFALCLNQATGDKRLLVHCAANYRVTAFVALYAMKYWNWREDQADALMAHVWRAGEYPRWDNFIQKMKLYVRAPLTP